MCTFTARDWRNCATCQFWTGQRKLNQVRGAASVDETACGTCALHDKFPKKYATSSCIGWRQWGLLIASA